MTWLLGRERFWYSTMWARQLSMGPGGMVRRFAQLPSGLELYALRTHALLTRYGTRFTHMWV